MEGKLSTNGHQWSEREVEIAGQNYFYRCCSLCWRAATIRLARFTLLDEITDAAWSSENCPAMSANS